MPGADLGEILPAARLLSRATQLTPSDYERAKALFLAGVDRAGLAADVRPRHCALGYRDTTDHGLRDLGLCTAIHGPALSKVPKVHTAWDCPIIIGFGWFLYNVLDTIVAE